MLLTFCCKNDYNIVIRVIKVEWTVQTSLDTFPGVWQMRALEGADSSACFLSSFRVRKLETQQFGVGPHTNYLVQICDPWSTFWRSNDAVIAKCYHFLVGSALRHQTGLLSKPRQRRSKKRCVMDYLLQCGLWFDLRSPVMALEITSAEVHRVQALIFKPGVLQRK